MKQWYVKELSYLTKISVQTLHHYDRIDLLKPSVRLDNNYRLYSEKDLLKLQQIIALKFFGFELAQIKKLLDGDVDMIDHFTVQSQFLSEKANALMTANQTLKKIVSDCRQNKSISWESIIESIEVFRMTQELEKTWAAKVFTPEELKQWASFQRELESRSNERESFQKNWNDLVSEVNTNLKNDPSSQSAIDIARRCMEMVNALYGEKYKSLQRAVWEKGFQGGYAGAEHGLSDAAVAWLDKAVEFYYDIRITGILMQIGKEPDTSVLKQWEALLNDMCGKNADARAEFLTSVINDPRCTQKTKDWLLQKAKNK
ncbi:MAG: MerR family transcriptional regulator [Gammaproteobacteria bacterium]|nr:MerR family transcriptional regulator [Gammaproteobacteria bacterium]